MIRMPSVNASYLVAVVLPSTSSVPTTTFRSAVLLVAPVPLCADVMPPVVLLFVPIVVAVTLTENAQLETAASSPFVRLIVPVPALAATFPPQAPESPFGVATTRPAGSESVNAICDSGKAPGLVTVKGSDVVPFSNTVEAPNALASFGGGGGPTLIVGGLVAVPSAAFVVRTTPVRLF